MMRLSPNLTRALLHTDADTSRICSASGLTSAAINGRITDLTEITRALEASIREAEAAEADERFYGRLLVAANLTVAVCDLIIEIADAGLGGKVVKAAYAQKDTLSEYFNGTVDRAKATNRLAKGAATFLPRGAKAVAGVATSVADTAIDGARGKLDAKKVVIATVKKDLALLEFALAQEGRSKAAAIVKRSKLALDLGVKAFDAFHGAAGPSGIASAKKTAIRMLEAYRAEIVRLSDDLKSCDDFPRPQAMTMP